MSFRLSRSSKKPQPRESEKPATAPKKKTLAESCQDMRVKLALAKANRTEAERKAREALIEDAVMATIYGPSWQNQLPEWAQEQERNACEANATRRAELQAMEDEEEEDIPYEDDDDEPLIRHKGKGESRVQRGGSLRKAG